MHLYALAAGDLFNSLCEDPEAAAAFVKTCAEWGKKG